MNNLETAASAAEVHLHNEVTVMGTYLIKDGESTFIEKFIVPVEDAEKALVSILTREEDSLRARLSAADARFRGIRTHVVTGVKEIFGVLPAPEAPPAPEPSVESLKADLAAAQEHLATDQGLFDSLNAKVADLTAQLSTANSLLSSANASLSAAQAQVATLTEDNDALRSQVASLSQSAAPAVEAPVAAPAPAAEVAAPAPVAAPSDVPHS